MVRFIDISFIKDDNLKREESKEEEGKEQEIMIVRPSKGSNIMDSVINVTLDDNISSKGLKEENKKNKKMKIAMMLKRGKRRKTQDEKE